MRNANIHNMLPTKEKVTADPRPRLDVNIFTSQFLAGYFSKRVANGRTKSLYIAPLDVPH